MTLVLRSLYCNLLLSIRKKLLLTIKGYTKRLLRRDIRSDLRPNDSSPLFGDLNVLFHINNMKSSGFTTKYFQFFILNFFLSLITHLSLELYGQLDRTIVNMERNGQLTLHK